MLLQVFIKDTPTMKYLPKNAKYFSHMLSGLIYTSFFMHTTHPLNHFPLPLSCCLLFYLFVFLFPGIKIANLNKFSLKVHKYQKHLNNIICLMFVFLNLKGAVYAMLFWNWMWHLYVAFYVTFHFVWNLCTTQHV